MANKKTEVKKDKKKSSSKKKKTLLGKAKPFALPAGALLGLGAPYAKRARETGIDISDLVLEDLVTFDMKEASQRMKDHAGAMLIPGVVGMVVKQTHLAGKASSVVADLLLGLALGTAAKALIDPPGAPDLSRQRISDRSIIDMQRTSSGSYAPRANLYG